MTGDTLVLNSECTVTSTRCQSTATYPETFLREGAVQINTTATSGAAGCLPVGTTTCVFSLTDSDSALNVYCGNSPLNYTRIK